MFVSFDFSQFLLLTFLLLKFLFRFLYWLSVIQSVLFCVQVNMVALLLCLLHVKVHF